MTNTRAKILLAFALLATTAACSGQTLHKTTDGKKYIAPTTTIDAAATGNKIPNIIIDKNVKNLPVVAVLLGQERGDYYEYTDYVNALTANGLYPIFISYDKIGEQLVAANPSGVILPGGAFGDLHKNSVSTDPNGGEPKWADLRRAFAYQVVIDYAAYHKLPTLGICAGAQEMAIYLNGKLRGYINVGNKTNHGGGNFHLVTAADGSLLESIVGDKHFIANSYHNSAVDLQSGGEYKVAAVSPTDSIPEAIEPTHPWSSFVLGVQFHPERMFGKDAPNNISEKIFNAFANAVRTQHNKQAVQK